jgi:Holliday junction DNA helicase RuvA
MFWTYLVVREDALDMYGFTDQTEVNFFELLIGVSGIGPKSALAILSLAPPETLRKAITSGDTGYLTKVSGVGRKSAEKIVLELRDKLGAIDLPGLREDLERESDSIEGLQALGYSLREAREALRKVPDNVTDPSERIRQALKSLNK